MQAKVPFVVHGSCFENQDLVVWVCTKPIGQHAAGRASTNNNEIVNGGNPIWRPDLAYRFDCQEPP